VKCDTTLARQLYSAAVETRLPVVGANYGTFEGPTSDVPIDWGTFVPLWFFLDADRHADRKIDKPKVVIVSPSREIPMQQNVAFGRVLGKLAASEWEKRIAFVASADQAHAHRRDGPYGYHRAAKEFDQLAVDAVKKGELDSLLALDPRFIEDAKPDSVWQIAMLQGILSTAPFRAELISYEVPTSFGTLCASFIPS
jgi:aromatic ring-opening dioxygenase LigB subunit